MVIVLSATILFILGACIGSFLAVVIIRSLDGRSWRTGRSSCDSCGKSVRWYQNIPLLSYALLRGRCSACGERIHPLHPFMELLTGMLFVWWYLFGFAFFQLVHEPLRVLQPLFWLLVGVLLVVILVEDLFYLLIPDWAVASLMGLVVLYRAYLLLIGTAQPRDIGLSLMISVGLVGLFFFLYWVTRGRGFGFGDVKLIAPLSLMTDWQEALVGVFLAFVLGAVVGVGLYGFKLIKRRQPIPFGPFLVMGFVIALLYGRILFDWYLQFLV